MSSKKEEAIHSSCDHAISYNLTAISPLDGRYAKKLTPLNTTMSEYGLINYRVLVEITWLKTICQHPLIRDTKLTNDELDYLNNISQSFDLNDAIKIKEIEQTTCHDIKAVEYFLQEKLKSHDSLHELIPLVHFAATSEDINNLAYALMLKDGRNTLKQSLSAIIQTLSTMASEHSTLAMLARTHGQAASPTTLGKELANVVYRLQREYNHFIECEITGSFNGAVGNYNAHTIAYPSINWLELTQQFVEGFDLSFNPMTTQIEPHDALAQLLDSLSRINTILLDLNKDLWGYISLGYFSLKKQDSETGSSTMPHKVNPIDFENSEGNLGIANALATHLARSLPISRWQRDLSDSTTLRNLGSIFGYSLLAYSSCLSGLNKLIPNKEAITKDLENKWETLAEAIQTILRSHGFDNAYEDLKLLTRGKVITKDLLHTWINQQELPDAAKTKLLSLTPGNYTGIAAKLAVSYINNKQQG